LLCSVVFVRLHRKLKIRRGGVHQSNSQWSYHFYRSPVRSTVPPPRAHIHTPGEGLSNRGFSQGIWNVCYACKSRHLFQRVGCYSYPHRSLCTSWKWMVSSVCLDLWIPGGSEQTRAGICVFVSPNYLNNNGQFIRICQGSVDISIRMENLCDLRCWNVSWFILIINSYEEITMNFIWIDK